MASFQPCAHQLSLTLQQGQLLASNASWRVEEGYVRMVSWTEQAEIITVGIWGPGEFVIPTTIEAMPIELMSISPAKVVEFRPTAEQEQQFRLDHLEQVSTLLVMNRVRPVEKRLLQLLVWLAERFGRVSSRGVSVPLHEMYLTHRQLAEIAGTTRVSVTKGLIQFRELGTLIKDGDQLFLHGSPSCLWRLPNHHGLSPASTDLPWKPTQFLGTIT